MAALATPARYFPVRDTPLEMAARLHPFGADFGNDDVDQQYFQLDAQAERYRHARRASPPGRRGVCSDTADERRAHGAVLSWIRTRLAREHPTAPTDGITTDDPPCAYAAVVAFIQEDLTVMLRRPDGDGAIAVYVDFPSSWRPERILGASFQEIHRPVPRFADAGPQAESMLGSMVDRGPYVRFVWTLAADDHLDHHPEEGRREPWREDGRGWLRVERQVTVPFGDEHASLFLIRTYLYPFDELAPDERSTLRRAIEVMPPDVARYKGLDGTTGAIARRLLSR